MKRIIAAALCLMIIVPCALAEGEVKINIVGMLENFEALEAIIADFEIEHPEIDVEYEYLDNYSDILPLRLQNASETTHLFLLTRDDVVKDEVLAGFCMDLSGEDSGIELGDLNSALLDSMRVEGALCAAPLAMNVAGIVVNKTLLAENGIDMPENFDEFCLACEKLAAVEGVTPIHAQFSQIALRIFYPYMVNSVVHSENYAANMESINAFEAGTGELFRDTYERVERLVKAAGVKYDPERDYIDNYNDAILSFMEGKTAFYPCTSEAMSGTKKREARSEAFTANPFEYEFCYAPVGDDGPYGYLQVWQAIALNPQAENIDAAKQFLNYLLSGESLAKFAEIKGVPSSGAESLGDMRYAALFTLDEAHTAQALQFQTTAYSCMRTTFERMVIPEEGASAPIGADEAVELYESLIAKKREG